VKNGEEEEEEEEEGTSAWDMIIGERDGDGKGDWESGEEDEEVDVLW